MNQSTNAYISNCNPIQSTVWYAGTDALLEGEGVCYNTDYGTAASVAGSRGTRVERPSRSNNNAFAGVAARNYSANKGGQFIEINVPGSTGVKIALGANVAIDTGILSFTAGAAGSHRGRFVKGGFAGRGSAYIRQTVAAAVIESDMLGAVWSLAIDGITLTMTATAGLAAGDTVVILAGESEDATIAVVPGKYTIASVTDATTVVLTSTVMASVSAAAVGLTGYAYTGNPTCQADLMTGKESGGTEFIAFIDAGGSTQLHMQGGVTFVCACTIAADAEVELAAGQLYGQRKGFWIIGTVTTSLFIVDLVEAGIKFDGAAALAEIGSMTAINDGWFGTWYGVWQSNIAAGNAAEA